MADRILKAPRNARTLLIWPAKAPDEVVERGFDWSDVLLSPAERARLAAGETVTPADGIKASSYVLPQGIVASASSNTATVALVTLTGGELGRVYSVANRIETAKGQQLERVVKLRIRAK
ncbi:hypothetical protein HU675_0035305 [Bradyrhizobium septentrionale]|uniref:phage fiber-tail adaptor protein n=1 Tax=Bradyrhizobium septentrionale TaxID=1404411 RepID=UPI0015970B0D|nr:hypothetical protein [Bradyrhizobium septentrionale]UGY23186.1 hypothetical protein HU675_0035305 [Bradyrhizobium septentrionale]